jgi:hypothetical protein
MVVVPGVGIVPGMFNVPGAGVVMSSLARGQGVLDLDQRS